MTINSQNFGILTLATPSDHLKAIGLALSLRASNPGVALAVACHPRLRERLAPHFDHVIDEIAGLRGFAHKVHLDEYSPFETTLFLDSDVLVFRPVLPFLETWGEGPYVACGKYGDRGKSPFGLDRPTVLARMGKSRLVLIDGAGHALFRKPACVPVFERAREITADYPRYAGDARYADEDVMDMVMTELELAPTPYGEFFSRYISARPGTLEMDATRAHCQFIAVNTGEPFRPCMMHFAANEAPIAYTLELRRLFKANGVAMDGLLSMGAKDFFDREVRPRLRRLKRLVAA